ncbi:hypothetical protein [Streptomyces chattanoogensis]|uniref:hypothetical protein n=1 Tax=Streptomyces chattanoogensis TaxID=66876 RepID=UPI00368EC55A
MPTFDLRPAGSLRFAWAVCFRLSRRGVFSPLRLRRARPLRFARADVSGFLAVAPAAGGCRCAGLFGSGTGLTRLRRYSPAPPR